jgi:hypothetical protein
MLRAASSGAAIFSLLAALVLPMSASADDLSEAAPIGGAYAYISPGVAVLPEFDVDVGPFGSRIYVEPGMAFLSPVLDDLSPASAWAPVYPQARLDVVPPESLRDITPSAGPDVAH